MIATYGYPPDPVVRAVGHYLHWGVIQISLTNLIIILAMIAVFVLALLLPFPGGRNEISENRDQISEKAQLSEGAESDDAG
jgi:hypothetical protein